MTEPTPPQPPVYDEPSGSRFQDKRALAIIGAAVVAVIAVGALVVVPKLGGSSSATSAAAVPHGHPKKAATPTPTSSPAAPAAVATAAPALNVRDPFKPLVVPPVAAAAAASPSAAPSTTPTSQAPTIVVVEPTASPSTAKYVVKLTKLTIDPNNDRNDSAVVVVNGKTQTVKGDQPFPTTNGPFALVGVATDGTHHQYDSGQFMYGDELFSLSINETQSFS